DLVEKAKDSEIIHYIFSPIVTLGGLRTVQRLKKKNKKIVVHWIGTDVYNAITRLKSKFITKRYKHLVDVHLAQHSRLVRELSSVGVNSEELPLPTFGLYSLYPMPARKKILVYMPESRGDFYGKLILDRVFDSFPESDFIVLPNSGKDINKANVTCISWTDDMEKIYRDVAVLIRLPIHEGMPNTVIEALSMGRYAICSHDFPYCEQARSLEEVKTKLLHLLQKSSLNQEGSDYVHNTYSKSLLTERLLHIYEQI
ncbi:MAG TPA: hypothetical protein VI698_00005, partial [Nitrososphaerales archaeon]|nr:hypothetical protein [Nitrososphaerales archaeon]